MPRLSAPLLGQEANDADACGTQSGPKGGVIRRVAAWHGPDPTVVLAALLSVAACVWCLEARVRALQATEGSGLGGGEATRIAQDGGALTFVDPASTTGLDFAHLTLLTAAAAAVLLASLQHFVQYWLRGLIKEAFGRPDRERLGVELDIESIRVWFFGGRCVVRNAVLKSPAGFGSEHVVLVRRLSADFGVRGLLRAALACKLDVQELRVEGVDMVVEHKGGDIASKSSLQVVLDTIEETSHQRDGKIQQVVPRHSLQIESLVIRNLAVRRFATAATAAIRADAPDRRFDHFNKEHNLAKSASDVLAALVTTMARDALDSLAGRT